MSGDIKFGITLGGNAAELVGEVRSSVSEFDKLKNAANNTGESASQSLRKMTAGQAEFSRKSAAYSALQIRSSHEIEQEITKVQAAYKRLGASGSVSTDELGRASRATKQRVAELKKELEGTSKATDSFTNSVKGLVAGTAIFYALSRGVKASEEAIVRQNSAILGLSSVAKYAGIEVQDTLAAALALSADGMMTNAESAKALQNLLTRGFGLPEAVQMINRFRDSAAFGRQASLGFGEAIVSATEGIKNENSILVDNAGVTKNVSVMWKEYASELGISVNNLTIVQKRQAEYNGIMRETEAQLGNAAQASAGLQGAQARLLKSSDDAAASFGKALTPALMAFYDAGTSVMGNVKELAPLLPEIATGLAAIAAQTLIAKAGLAGMSITMVSATLAAKSLAKSLLPLAAAEGVLKVFELGGIAVDTYAAKQEAAASRIRGSSQAVNIFGKYLLPAREELKRMGIELDNINSQNIDQVTNALRSLNRERDKSRPVVAGNNEASMPSPESGKPVAPIDPKLVAKSLADAKSLTAQLGAAFDDTFTKTSDKYVETWQSLVATQGEGSAQVKSLESAYQSWLDNTWDKQAANDEKRTQKTIAQEQKRVNNVIQLQQAKYVRLNQAASDAALSDSERPLAKLDRDLATMADERQRLVDQKIWTDDLESQYAEARIARAQITADTIGEIEDQEAGKRLQKLADGEQAAYDLKGQFQQLVSSDQQVNLDAMANNIVAFAKGAAAWDEWTGRQKLGFAAATMSALSGLMKSENRKQFEVGKAAAQGENAINTYLGATKAYQAMASIAYVGPVLGGLAAAAVVAAGMANASKINSAKMGGSTGGVAVPTMSAGGGGAMPSIGMNTAAGIPQSQQSSSNQPSQHVNVYVSGVVSQDQLVNEIIPQALKDKATNEDYMMFTPQSRQAQELQAA